MNREAARQISSLGQFQALATARTKRSYKGDVSDATLRVLDHGESLENAAQQLSDVMWDKWKTNISVKCAEQMINLCKYTATAE